MIGWNAAALLPAHEVPLRYRTDGITPDRQRAFLVAIAEGQTVEAACRHVGIAPSSVYALRQRAAGMAFALGWRGASLHARARLEGAMWSRAIDGFTETTTRPDGSVVVRHRHDNRLAMAMLTRLDKLAADPDPGDPFGHAARTVHLAFDEYLEMVEHGTANDAAHFLLARAARQLDQPELPPALAAVSALREAEAWLQGGDGPPDADHEPDEDEDDPHAPKPGDAPDAPPPDTADLVLEQRQGWTNAQWERAEAAGLVTIDCPAQEWLHNPPSPPLPDAPRPRKAPRRSRFGPGWQDGEPDQPAPDLRVAVWRMPGDPDVLCTCFPAEPGFVGLERGAYGEDAYWRACTPAEAAGARASEARALEDRRHHEARERDFYFGPPDGEYDAKDETLFAKADRLLAEVLRSQQGSKEEEESAAPPEALEAAE